MCVCVCVGVWVCGGIYLVRKNNSVHFYLCKQIQLEVYKSANYWKGTNSILYWFE